MSETAGLIVAPPLADFVAQELAPASGIPAAEIWSVLDRLVVEFAEQNSALLKERDRLQTQITAWLTQHPGQREPLGLEDYLTEIGYLRPEVPAVLETTTVDPEIGQIAGPQLVVPATNARYALNAANARWGSLYDAVYGTDVLGSPPPAGPYDPIRGTAVVAWVRDFLDASVPLHGMSYRDVVTLASVDGALVATDTSGWQTGLTDPTAFVGVGRTGSSFLLTHHGLGIDVIVDRDSPVGANDPAGISDVLLESAVSTIVDLEDSVSTVTAADKVTAYRTWLGLMTGSLTAIVTKGTTFTRTLTPDRVVTGPDGDLLVKARALLLVRNVGLHLSTDSVRTRNGDPIPEGLLDTVITVVAGIVDLRVHQRNSATGSIYIVKPKLHGPDEVEFVVRTMDRVEVLLALPEGTIRFGLMDEDVRTAVNLAACVAAGRRRIAFINTGFLDRTGDEIHTFMAAGPVVGKAAMRRETWILAYEDRNVDLGLAAGFPGRAQIGKGMWAAPQRMADMLDQKIVHPRAGASCAWVPSPTAATLHAVHYHRVNVAERQREIAAGGERAPRGDLLVVPLATELTPTEIDSEVDNAAQGILGYVVRWVMQGVGCSTVPDIHGVGLMEDRATLRISAQLLANWRLHGVIDDAGIDSALSRMADVVDAQNAADPGYMPIGQDPQAPAMVAARRLINEGVQESSGYTEPVLTQVRRTVLQSP